MEETLVSELIGELKEKVYEVKHLDLKRPKELFKAVVIVIRFIESLAKQERIVKTDKKTLALEILNTLIDVPYIPEFLEQSLFSWLIDMCVETLNRTLGKLWLEKVNQ